MTDQMFQFPLQTVFPQFDKRENRQKLKKRIQRKNEENLQKKLRASLKQINITAITIATKPKSKKPIDISHYHIRM